MTEGDGAENAPSRKRTRPCPICHKMSHKDYHPFCSKRCADVDLHRWLSGSYAIPAMDPPDEFEEEEMLRELGGDFSEEDD